MRDPLDPSRLLVRDKQSYPAAFTFIFYLRCSRNHQRDFKLSCKRIFEYSIRLAQVQQANGGRCEMSFLDTFTRRLHGP